ncbi:MAG: CoA pyrophosphatase [Flavobacteriales bacterium]|nr:CoA pyrophosphatase [Flavobacteriales bacterium]
MVEKIILELSQSFSRIELPGEEAHSKLIPSNRKKVRENLSKDPEILRNARESAVYILIFFDEVYKFYLIKRPPYEGVHSGQIALPGGKTEPEDTSLEQTAMREMSEELGISDGYSHLGALSPLYIPPSNFLVYPFVGICDFAPVVNPDPYEVDQVFAVSIDELIRADIKDAVIKKDESIKYRVPSFEFSNHVVWGATAMILSEFRDILMKLEKR